MMPLSAVRKALALERSRTVMAYVWATLFILSVFLFWSANLLGLPGNWMILAVTVAYAWLATAHSNITWTIVGIVTGLAVLGEIVELGASASGVKRVGGSRRGAVLALLGSIVGATAGLFVGIPIPLVGSVIAALLFAGLGAFLGAALGELTIGRTVADSWRVGHAAFWGRLYGTLAKTLIGAVMAGVAMALVVV